MKMKQQITTLINEYLTPFYTFAVSRTHNVHEAEELAQEIVYQCVVALNKSGTIDNLNSFLWSVAHNTYKRWLYKKRRGGSISLDGSIEYANNITDMSPHSNIEESMLKSEEVQLLRKELSFLTNFYRKTLVLFYYDELSITEISRRLGLSVEMAKFYLQKGREKLKEAYIMSKEYGEKSFNPSPFAVYRGTYGFCGVNVWEIFKRNLPCQIALICYDSPKRTDEISLETGVPTAYIEDELAILVKAELLICPVKGKYQTNFFILRKNALSQLKEQFEKMYSKYIPTVIGKYEKYLPEMKNCGIFTYDAQDKRYAWFYEDKVINFTGANTGVSEDNCMTLADGVKGFVYAQEEAGNPNTKGHCNLYLEKDRLNIHASAPGDLHFQRCQRELVYEVRNGGERKIYALYDIYRGETKEGDIEMYAQLIEQSYAFKEHGRLVCDVAVHTEKSKQLFEKINGELALILAPLCKEIYENVSRIVASTIPPQLKQYVHGYTMYELDFYANIYFREALYGKGFLTVPEDNDKTPVSCWLEKL